MWQFERATVHLSDHEHFKGLIASGNVEGADHLVCVALKNNCSTSEICHRMVRAASGLYHVKTFTPKQYDLMHLSGDLGGPKLQFAIANALQLPSISSAQEHSLVLLIEACIAFSYPSTSTILLLSTVQVFCGKAHRMVTHRHLNDSGVVGFR